MVKQSSGGVGGKRCGLAPCKLVPTGMTLFTLALMSASQRDTCLNLKGSLLQGLALLATEFGLGEWGKWKDSRGRLQLVQKAIQMQMVAGASKEFLTVKQLPKGNGMSGKLCPSQHHKI